MTAAGGRERLDSGTPGLDDVLTGGFLPGQTVIVSGGPGTGKTVLASQFLAAGDDSSLYICFEEREADLRRNAEALGIDLSNTTVVDLSADGDRFFAEESYSVFPTDEVEGEDLLDTIAEAIDSHDPTRLVIDPLSELRSLLPDGYQFRRNISSLINELRERETTTLCTTQYADDHTNVDLQFLGDVTIEIRRSTKHRTLEVTKFRGSASASGRHTYRIRSGTGGHVYPKLVPGDHHRESSREQLSSGIDELDALLGGGVEQGSVTVVSGPSGVGKTTVGTAFLRAAANRGQQSAAFLFEELRGDYLYRAAELGIDVREFVDDGSLVVEEIESLTQSPDEFAHSVRQAVEVDGADVVLLDGTAGYRLGLQGGDSQNSLTRELHALCRYLKRMGVTVILVEEVQNVTGEFTATSERISYLADNIVFLRYLEVDGEIQKAIGVLKKRFGEFEPTLRKLSITTGGVDVGEQLTGLRGVLTGTPEFVSRRDSQ
ncbi:circadian clock protein KaiC [Halogranum gelatinilyticum]|uniref:non-specific serine/threonine protein kinase n=1 Tax=Halogranum gelatinilyticum TaxID=660521 RepID=A0A1G9UAI9_9EURY|nr:ATPase domain-containing protein [Halogranum gelatinilyticum]SDM56565.1 circadian clock protein KaiC [Halogranum gelatinilyticum]